MKNPRASLRCGACRIYQPADRVGIRDRVDEQGVETTEIVCRKCQREERGEWTEGRLKVVRWRSVSIQTAKKERV